MQRCVLSRTADSSCTFGSLRSFGAAKAALKNFLAFDNHFRILTAPAKKWREPVSMTWQPVLPSAGRRRLSFRGFYMTSIP
jgi:hypothetical protein